MAYEAVIYNQEGKAINDVRAIFDRAWLLNSYEQCTFQISARNELARLGDFTFGNYLGITDTELDNWGGYFDPDQGWSTKSKVTMQAYSGEKLFEMRAFPGELALTGTAGTIYREIIENMNAVLPWPTLISPGNIYEGGYSRQETINAKKFYEDVTRIATRSGNDFWCEPIIADGTLRFDGHWYARRGEIKEFTLEEGINVEAKDNMMEYQGEIWNYIFAFGNGATWALKETAVVYDQASIDKYGPRMYALAVDSNDQSTIEAYAAAFCNIYKDPRRSFNLTVGGNNLREDAVYAAFKVLRVGDIVDVSLHSVDHMNGRLGVNSKARIRGITHRGKKNVLELIANEVKL